MSWRDKLNWAPGNWGKASFRGAPFYVSTSETGVGRRTEMHVYPDTKVGLNQDYVWAEDLGAEPDEFVIEGFVIQNLENGFDHFPERDRLIKALKTYTDVNKRNVGILVHPFYGKLEVSLVGKAKITESLTKEGGIARFQMTFQQYNKPIFAQQTPDNISLVDTSVLSAINAALDSFTSLMRTAGNYLSTITGPITSTMNRVQTAINSVKGAISSTINTALSTVSSCISLISTVLSSPCDLANLILDAVDAVKQIPGMAGDVIQGGIIGGCSGVTRGDQTTLDGTEVPENMGVSLSENLANQSKFSDSDLEQLPREGASDIMGLAEIPAEQALNITLIGNMAQTAMIGNACMIAIRTDFSSQDQMEATLEIITTALDTLIERLGEQTDILSITGATSISDTTSTSDSSVSTIETLFQSVQKMRADFISSMRLEFSDLAKEYDYQVNYDIENSLTLAYKKYEDLDRADDIVYRNSTKHPGFLPSGDSIRLLSE